MAARPPATTWLVTGASSGLGRSICTAALAARHKVIGASRDVSQAAARNPDFVIRGGVWIQLDPAHPDSGRHFARVQEEYDVDVLVNNAGYSFIGSVEDTSEEEVMDQLNVNFLGPLRAVQAVLPAMRTKRRGHIVLISSGIVHMNPPGRAFYKASKSAIESIHDILEQEVSPFGIKVLIVEPGGFRTTWTSNLKTPAAHEATGGFSAGYKGTVLEQWVGRVPALKTAPLPDFIRGDPDKAGRAIVEAVLGGYDRTRMMLGPDCVAAAKTRLDELRGDIEAVEGIAFSMDVDGDGTRDGPCETETETVEY